MPRNTPTALPSLTSSPLPVSTFCGAGFFTTRVGSALIDTKCERCEGGRFKPDASAGRDAIERCAQQTRCAAGYRTLAPSLPQIGAKSASAELQLQLRRTADVGCVRCSEGRFHLAPPPAPPDGATVLACPAGWTCRGATCASCVAAAAVAAAGNAAAGNATNSSSTNGTRRMLLNGTSNSTSNNTASSSASNGSQPAAAAPTPFAVRSDLVSTNCSRHSTCYAGKYMRENGSASADTVCVACGGGRWQDGRNR